MVMAEGVRARACSRICLSLNVTADAGQVKGAGFRPGWAVPAPVLTRYRMRKAVGWQPPQVWPPSGRMSAPCGQSGTSG